MGVKIPARALKDSLPELLTQIFSEGTDVKVKVRFEPTGWKDEKLVFTIEGPIEAEGVIRLPLNRSPE
jgi:hypothetical protein